MAVSQLPDGCWMVYYRLAGKLKKEYFGRGAAAETDARARDKKLGLKKRRPVKAGYDGPDFADCAEVYVTAKTVNENSRKHVKIRLQANLLPFFGHLPVMRLNDSHLDAYVAQRRRDRVKDSTIHRELTDLQAILNFAARRRPAMIPFNPVRDYRKPREDDEIIPPPTHAEIERILEAAAGHLKRALIIAYYTGLRPGAVELLRLNWSDVDRGRHKQS